MTAKKNIYIILTFIIIIGSGFFLTWTTWEITIDKLAEETLEKTAIIASSLDITKVENLLGDTDDLLSYDYLRIKEQLRNIRLSQKTCKFLYIMGQKDDGTVFFFVDSQLEDSPDYASPGLVYTEVSDEYLYTFETGEKQTVGPVTDRWGTIITCLVPIYDHTDSRLIAVLGMDTDIADWYNQILSNCILPVSLTVFIIILAILLILLFNSRQNLKNQYDIKNKITKELKESLTHVKKLQGLLPICASCKKVRDDKGYWNELESYIENHTDAQFTHGICEECAFKLYGYEEISRK